MERELLLLGLLRGHEMHGYQLMEFIDTQMASCVDLKKPTAYFLLDKMTAAGWIHFEQNQEGNRPPRRVYGITTEGEKAFQRLLRENLAAYEPARFISDIGLAFVDALPAEEDPAEAVPALIPSPPICSIDTAESGISSIIWCTGFSGDFSWVKVPGVLDDGGQPIHQAGVSVVRGIYFAGLDFGSTRKSGTIPAVAEEADKLLCHIVKSRVDW